MDSDTARAAAFWNKMSSVPRKPRTRWWESPTINRHINEKVCGKPLDGLHSGFHELLKDTLGGHPAAKAVSVGCGTGNKELSLVRSGLVGEFHLYEIASDRIATGRERARGAGLEDRMIFHQEDAFAACNDKDFDLVYWNNALHHMMDTRQAVRWSRDRLRLGGIFAMDDFIGPSRFQWTDRALGFAQAFRHSLRDDLLKDPRNPEKPAAGVVRHTIERMMDLDPSEAADSSSILQAVENTFPGATIIRTGGAIYHTALNDILANFEEDGPDLKQALLLDDALSQLGENHYAVGIAIKAKPRWFFPWRTSAPAAPSLRG